MKKHTHQKRIYGNSERSNRQGSKFLRRKWQELKQEAQPNPLEFTLEDDIMKHRNHMMRLI